MTAILATGGAALAVNATVLNPQAEASATPAPTPDSAAPASTADEFQIPGVGLVTLTNVSGVLRLDSVTANPGYSYSVVEATPGEYEIRFASSAQVVTFSAKLVDGQILTSASGVSTQQAGAQPVVATPVGVAGAGGGSVAGDGTSGGIVGGVDDGVDDDGYDDDGYDDHEDDDHEDDDHGGEHEREDDD